MSNNTETQNKLIYFDQNVLFDFAYGHLEAVRNIFFEELDFRLMYSRENLEELRRVPNEHYEPILTFLSEVGAIYATTKIDNSEVVLNTEVNPRDAFSEYCEAVSQFSDLDYTKYGLHLKLQGGDEGRSWKDMAQVQTEEFNSLLDNVLDNIDTNDISEEWLCALKDEFEGMKLRAASTADQVANMISDAEKQYGSRIVDDMFQVDVEKISPLNVLHQVWDQAKDKIKADGYDAGSICLEQILVPQSLIDLGLVKDRENNFHKVNAIYGLLNLWGYCRDKGIKKIRGQKRAFSDATHAGFALSSHIFVCRDKRLVKKAVAAYEYLNLKSPVVIEVKGDPRIELGNVNFEMVWPIKKR